MILDNKTQLGVNTVLGSSGAGHHFAVILEVESETEYQKAVRGWSSKK